ncbi:hypothetical protein H6F78_24640 [Coleofasciculus sp. FACHB-64]|uniref:hypothetical protein n=1 Tax=Cyanophyceae TaxID=3028117 RepID=UPI00168315E2|nr:hypothetical protein [Coleofasciculus sp. FACHB-64]MBD2048747.1 hypothetical protein [Coleofasciculus sp. FACHB-64]
MPQSAAVIVGCDRLWHEVRMRSLIHSLPTFPATLAMPQSAAITAGCDRTPHATRDRALEKLRDAMPHSSC